MRGAVDAAMKLLVCVALASARLQPLRKSLVHGEVRGGASGSSVDTLAVDGAALAHKGPWFCVMNTWDEAMASCAAPEELP